MLAQSISIQENILLQENKLSILIVEKRRLILDKRTCAMNVKYFAAKDHIDRGEFQTYHCPTEDMIGNFFHKAVARIKIFQV